MNFSILNFRFRKKIKNIKFNYSKNVFFSIETGTLACEVSLETYSNANLIQFMKDKRNDSKFVIKHLFDLVIGNEEYSRNK